MALPTPAATSSIDSRTGAWPLGTASPWLWALASFAWYAVAAYLTLPVITMLPTQFAVQPVIWGAAAVAGALLLARLFFGHWVRVSWAAAAVAVSGLLLAGLLEVSLHAWAIDRFGTFSWQLIGPTAGLFVVVVGSAIAGFGVLVAPRGASLPPLLAAVGAALVSGLVVAFNMPGLQNGLPSESVPAALFVATGGAYTLVVAAVAVIVAARRELGA
jgi:hypothetical protein